MSSRALINRPVQTPSPIGSYGLNGTGSDVNSLDILALLKRKFFLIAGCIVLGIVVSVAYFLMAPQTYESTAKIFVDEKNAPSIDSSRRDPVEESKTTKYMQIIKSTLVLKPAIENGEFEKLVSFQDEDDVLYLLREETDFDVQPASRTEDSGVIKISFQGRDAADCKLVLAEILDSFDEYIASTTKSLGGETTRLVEKMQGHFTGRLKQVNAEIKSLLAHPELLLIDGKIVNPYQTEQTKIQEDLHELLRERTRLTARATKIRHSRELGINEELLMTDVMQEFSDSTLGAYEATHDQYVELKVKEQQMLNQFGSQHPELISLRSQIEMVNRLRMQELSTLRGGKEVEQSESARDMIDIFLDLMDRKIEMLSLEEQSLKDSLIEQQVKSQELALVIEELTTLQREREQLELGYAAMAERLGEIQAYETHLWRNMTVLDQPELGEQVAPSLPICLAGGLLLGCLVGFLLAGMKELSEKTFRSSEEVAASLDSRIVGLVPQFSRSRVRKSSNFPRVAPEIVTIHQPASVSSEAYRAIRTNLFFRASTEQAKVVQFSSPSAGDGKSTTAANIAASIAQAGRSVLLIDADLRRPSQHQLFGIDRSKGLTSIIAGEADPEDCIQTIVPGQLALIPSGETSANPAEMLSSHRFEAMLVQLRTNFDFIIIDSPPLVSITDATIVGANADLFYLVMRIRNGVRDASRTAREILDSVGIDLAGVVINGLNRHEFKTFQYSSNRGYYRNGPATFSLPVSAREEQPGQEVSSV
jgi:succinoglycan biosynthesis transport protein ExoP